MLDFDELEEIMEEKTHFSRFLCLHKHAEKGVFSVGIPASSVAFFFFFLADTDFRKIFF